MLSVKDDIIAQLRQEILRLQGFRPPTPGAAMDVGLGPVTKAFPNGVFPTGAMHELISPQRENAAATCGFLAGLVSGLMASGGVCVWVSAARKIYPPGLKAFGIEPDQVVFMDMRREKDVLRATEEALQCEGLAAVVGEIRDISFNNSRRLQLAMEQSRVTGFLLRHNPCYFNPVAAVARWHITHLPSEPDPGMPGLGIPRWNVELSKVRNGRPGSWQMEWQAGRFLCKPRPTEAAPVRVQPARTPVGQEKEHRLTG
jgi:protein ImuA